MTLPAPRFFMLRVRRDGPLVPARLRWLDHEPGVEWNKLDRGRLSTFPAADVAGEEVDPDFLIRDRLMSPTDLNPAYSSSHWKYASPITETEYRYQVARVDWARRHKPADPSAQPRRPVDPGQLALPNFDRENAA